MESLANILRSFICANNWFWLDIPSAINTLSLGFVDSVFSVFPSTPPSLQIVSFLSSLSDAVPLLGFGEIYQIFKTLESLALVGISIKVYKLLPFKFS